MLWSLQPCVRHVGDERPNGQRYHLALSFSPKNILKSKTKRWLTGQSYAGADGTGLQGAVAATLCQETRALLETMNDRLQHRLQA
ncbi:hypothetical protein J0S82_001014 [Galemys pyrenaicus]|uniref:Uncharacterized protein n=1 Tax=Galemys pyrenaicus TaxID=202257 RepID=A0A8J6AG31_GALPY|nr:hypothetical protein J0S82_001014 [Galemys pyrenaicus]